MKNIYKKRSRDRLPTIIHLPGRLQKYLLSIPLVIFISFQSYSQGCVAIRSTGVCTMEHPMGDSVAKSWQLNTGYRYFRSFRHFRGKEEQKERLVKNIEVIN